MGLLSLAGAVSGAGQAVTQGLNTIQTGMIASDLQKERDKMETRRMELMNQYANEREERGYAHADATLQKTQDFAHGQNQEKFGQDVVQRSMAQAHDEEMQGKRQGFEGGQQKERLAHDSDKTASTEKAAADRQREGFAHAEAMQQTGFGHDIVKSSLASQAQSDEKAKDRELHAREHGETMAAQKAHYEAVMAHYNEQAAQTRDKITHILPGDNGEQYGVTQNGRTVLLKNSETGKPIVGTKGLTEAAKALSTSYEKEAEALEKSIDPMMPAADQAPIRAQARAMRMKGRTYLGEKAPEPAAPVKIVDRFDPANKSTAVARGDKAPGGLMDAAAAKPPITPSGPSVSKLPVGAVPVGQAPVAAEPKPEPYKPGPKPVTQDMANYVNSSQDLATSKGMLARSQDDARHTQEMLAREQGGTPEPTADAAEHTNEMLKREAGPTPASLAPPTAGEDLERVLKGSTPAAPQKSRAAWPRELQAVLSKDDKLTLADSLDIYKRGKMTTEQFKQEAREIFGRYFRPDQVDAAVQDFMVVAAQSKKKPGAQ